MSPERWPPKKRNCDKFCSWAAIKIFLLSSVAQYNLNYCSSFFPKHKIDFQWPETNSTTKDIKCEWQSIYLRVTLLYAFSNGDNVKWPSLVLSTTLTGALCSETMSQKRFVFRICVCTMGRKKLNLFSAKYGWSLGSTNTALSRAKQTGWEGHKECSLNMTGAHRWFLFLHFLLFPNGKPIPNSCLVCTFAYSHQGIKFPFEWY